jgi:hypothetical protein
MMIMLRRAVKDGDNEGYKIIRKHGEKTKKLGEEINASGT